MPHEKPIANWQTGLKWLNPDFGTTKARGKTRVNRTKKDTIAVIQAIRRTHGHPFYPVTDAETFDSGTQKSKDLYGFIDILVGHDRAI